MPKRTKDINVRFNLKSTRDKNKPTSINAIYRYGTPVKKLKYSTGRTIAPKHWDSRKQLPRVSYDQYSELKHNLDNLSDLIRSIHHKKGDAIETKEFRSILDVKLNKIADETDSESFIGFWESYIEGLIQAKNKSNRTAAKFRSSLNHMKKFFVANNITPSFEAITWDSRQQLINYLFDTYEHSQNNVAKIIANLQLVMREALKRKLHSNKIMDEKGFRLKTVKTKNKIRLDEDELRQIYLTNYPTQRMQRVADMAIVGCYTGLRYSDWSTVKKESIYLHEGMELLRIMSYKTKEELPIPVLPELKVILEKYDYNLPKFTDQEFNRVFKKVCELAIPGSKFLRIYNKAGKTQSEQSNKYDFAGTHACRRSFASNFYEMGQSANVLMHITGHASEKQFLEYVDVDVNKMALTFARDVLRRRKVSNNLTIVKGA